MNLTDTASSQARRLQLRMRNPTDCRQTVAIFERRGMEFQEQRPRIAARPGTGRPSTDTSQNRLLTVQTNSPYVDPQSATAKASPVAIPAIEAGSFARSRPVSPARSLVRSGSPYDQSERVSQEMLPPMLFSRDVAAAPTEVIPTRPSTAQMYRSYTTPSQPSHSVAQEAESRHSNPSGERPSSSSHIANLGAIHHAAEEYESPPRVSPDKAPPSFHRTEPNQRGSSGSFNVIQGSLLSSGLAEPPPVNPRPSTSATTPLPDTLEHEIPPRRELPFGRPESRRSGSEKSGSRPGTSALTLPPLPKPKVAREGPASPDRSNSASPSKDASPSRPDTASSLKRSFAAYRDDGRQPDTSLGIAQKSISPQHPSAKGTSPEVRKTGSEAPTKEPSRMDELLYGKKPLMERSPNTRVPRLNSLADAPHELESPPGTALSPPKSQHLPSPTRTSATEKDPTIGAYAAIRSTSRHPQEASIEVYAAQSLEDRQTTLDEFMVEHLENSSFMTLCEDVENCWRKIALGL